MPCAIRNPRRQRGVALVIVVIALLAVLAMAGLALDASHMGYNKARLQSAVDAQQLRLPTDAYREPSDADFFWHGRLQAPEPQAAPAKP